MVILGIRFCRDIEQLQDVINSIFDEEICILTASRIYFPIKYSGYKLI